MANWGQKLWGYCAGPFLDQMQWNFKFGFEIPLCVPHKLFRMIFENWPSLVHSGLVSCFLRKMKIKWKIPVISLSLAQCFWNSVCRKISTILFPPKIVFVHFWPLASMAASGWSKNELQPITSEIGLNDSF